jgi:hypothetical protein
MIVVVAVDDVDVILTYLPDDHGVLVGALAALLREDTGSFGGAIGDHAARDDGQERIRLALGLQQTLLRILVPHQLPIRCLLPLLLVLPLPLLLHPPAHRMWGRCTTPHLPLFLLAQLFLTPSFSLSSPFLTLLTMLSSPLASYSAPLTLSIMLFPPLASHSNPLSQQSRLPNPSPSRHEKVAATLWGSSGQQVGGFGLP